MSLEGELDALAAETGFSGVVRVDRGGEVELARAYGLAHRATGSRTSPTRGSGSRAARRG